VAHVGWQGVELTGFPNVRGAPAVGACRWMAGSAHRGCGGKGTRTGSALAGKAHQQRCHQLKTALAHTWLSACGGPIEKERGSILVVV
jgi:hypothetical protein